MNDAPRWSPPLDLVLPPPHPRDRERLDPAAPTAPASPRACGCRRTPSAPPSPPCSSTCPTASATARRERDALTHPYLAGHGYAVGARRHPRLGRVRRRAVRRVQPAGAGRRARGHRLAGGPAVVHGRGRHDRHLVGRLQRAAGRGAPAAGAQGDRHAVLDRRSLSRRRALHGRRQAQRRLRLGGLLLRRHVPSARSRAGRRALAGDVARAAAATCRCSSSAGWQHQHRDAYWRHGSVCEDYAAIECPVYAVGGWTDGYTNAIPRLLEHLSAPRKGLIGPWAHAYPHFARPGPQVGFLQEMLRWWDHWLKGRDTGVMDEPMLRAWMTDSHVPRRASRDAARPLGGRAVLAAAGACDAAPVPDRCGPAGRARAARRARGLLAARASAATPANGARSAAARTRRTTSARTTRSRWCSRRRRSAEPVEILGAPVVTLEVASDRPVAQLIARLCDVHPDGRSLRVSFGVLNLTHRDGSRRAVGRWCRGSAIACGCSSTIAARAFRPGIGSGWRCRRPTGRWSGPRPRRRR